MLTKPVILRRFDNPFRDHGTERCWPRLLDKYQIWLVNWGKTWTTSRRQQDSNLSTFPVPTRRHQTVLNLLSEILMHSSYVHVVMGSDPVKIHWTEWLGAHFTKKCRLANQLEVDDNAINQKDCCGDFSFEAEYIIPLATRSVIMGVEN